MENEEIIKKIIQADFQKNQLDDEFTNQIINRLDKLPQREIQPLISKTIWIKVGLFAAFILVTILLIETNFVIELDFPGLTKSIGMFLSELTLPLIGIIAALILIVLDRLFGRRLLRFK